MELLLEYAQQQFLAESPALFELRQFALDHQYSHKLTRPLQTQFLCFLLRQQQAYRVIEVGAFVGYTTLAMAEALPDDGEVIACDHNAAWVEKGRPYWERAGVAHKIATCIDDAKISLQCLLDEGQGASFDFIYIDAEKRDYEAYLRLGLRLLKIGGMLAFDNVLKVCHGTVADPQTPTTRVLAEFNKMITQRDDLNLSLIPIYDGLLLVSKKKCSLHSCS